MEIVCISDTHNKHKNIKLPEGDLLIHAGDFTSYGYKHEVESFIKWLIKNKSKYTHGIVFIAGNHDRSFDPKYRNEYIDDEIIVGVEQPKTKPEWLEEILLDLKENHPTIHYLENSSTIINNYKIWGSPITPWFNGNRWAFNKHRGEDIKETWMRIPSDVDIIITHGPVSGKLDYVPDDSFYAGCIELREKIESLQNVKLHVCGHIHEAYGLTGNDKTIYVNACVCNFSYQVVNEPIIIKDFNIWI